MKNYNWIHKLIIGISLLVLQSACNNSGSSSSSGVNSSSNIQSKNSLDLLYSSNTNHNRALLGSTIGNQQSFNIFPVTGAVKIASNTITFYTDSACTTIESTATLYGPVTYSSANGTLYTTDQSLYYVCENMFPGGCGSELTNINSVQFSYITVDGQMTTMPCMANDRIANYTIESSPTACTLGSPCGFSNMYSTYTLFPAFAWINGESTTQSFGVYGTQGIPSASNIPGARDNSINWTDESGNMWLFGGYGFAASGSVNYLNDLWQYNPNTGMWTWVGGESIANSSSIYGIKGIASESNIPGARSSPVSWVDESGNLWLFGGNGYATSDNLGYLNDLWQYNPNTGMWTWVGGENTDNSYAIYGTKGIASTSNIPGARCFSISWADDSGNLWLFGGQGYAASGDVDYLNDLWKYNINAGTWTWVSGADSVNGKATYGIQGIASTSNIPGARRFSISWIDESSNLWLFGGDGYATSDSVGNLNDLWKYNINAGTWTWVSGADSINGTGIYGTQGTESASNMPGARFSPVSWADESGNLWLFGGSNDISVNSFFNDLWRYNISTGMWTWVGGESTLNNTGVYGTRETASANNIPGARMNPLGWTDESGNLWLFGGIGFAASASGGSDNLNDLWRINLGN